jgi:hypothetical protein
MRTDADARRATLYAALGFCQLAPAPDMPEITAFKRWMSTWRGIGDIVTGMERQGYADVGRGSMRGDASRRWHGVSAAGKLDAIRLRARHSTTDRRTSVASL